MSEKKNFYITTPIYYPSGKLHIGSAYTTIACDVLARYKRLMGYDVFYLTGLDEHGQKISKSGRSWHHTSSLCWWDGGWVKELWKLLDISYDKFIRTTVDYHEKSSGSGLWTLACSRWYLLGEYSGWYSVSDEEFLQKASLRKFSVTEAGNVTGGIAPSGHEVEWVSDEAARKRQTTTNGIESR